MVTESITPDPERPWSLLETRCFQCGKYSPTDFVVGRFTCSFCGFQPRQPDEPAPGPAPRRVKPTAAADPDTDDAIAVLVALGVRAADARALVDRAVRAGIRGAEPLAAWCCRARTG